MTNYKYIKQVNGDDSAFVESTQLPNPEKETSDIPPLKFDSDESTDMEDFIFPSPKEFETAEELEKIIPVSLNDRKKPMRERENTVRLKPYSLLQNVL